MQSKGPTVMILSLSPVDSLHKSQRFFAMQGNIVFQIKSEGLHTPDGLVFTLLVMDMRVFYTKFSYHVMFIKCSPFIFPIEVDFSELSDLTNKRSSAEQKSALSPSTTTTSTLSGELRVLSAPSVV